tara:strand:- start:335 stop:655 length:321 start_codon:yes stop_codon:yes gene_type:complete
MNSYLVTADLPDTENMAAAYDLFVIVIEDGTLDDEFKEFKVVKRVHGPHALKVFIFCEANGYLSMSKHFAPWKVKFDIDFDIIPVITDAEKIAEHKMVGEMLMAEG